jgi:hypothetical protein
MHFSGLDTLFQSAELARSSLTMKFVGVEIHLLEREGEKREREKERKEREREREREKRKRERKRE